MSECHNLLVLYSNLNEYDKNESHYWSHNKWESKNEIRDGDNIIVKYTFYTSPMPPLWWIKKMISTYPNTSFVFVWEKSDMALYGWALYMNGYYLSKNYNLKDLDNINDIISLLYIVEEYFPDNFEYFNDVLSNHFISSNNNENNDYLSKDSMLKDLLQFIM